MMDLISMPGKSVVLGVGGGIAAYKSCELASRLTQIGVRVQVVMTPNAQRFVAPLTFQALTRQPVHTSLWPADSQSEAGVAASMAHIALAESADAILIAPASADLIARLAHGLADDLLTTLVLAARAPILVAPAMNPAMFEHPATQANLAILRGFGYFVIEPESGRMACEQIGRGRLPTTEVLIRALEKALQSTLKAQNEHTGLKKDDWRGLKVLLTAGPTRENLDPVRFLSNRSSGRMGHAIAQAARARGARVTMVCGPTNLSPLPEVERIDVSSALEMRDAVAARFADCDIFIAAAAPADYRAALIAPHKLKKQQNGELMTLELIANPDIVSEMAHRKCAGQIVVGFAAETQNVMEEARRKLQLKKLDAIVANDVSQSDAGFDVETNRVTWITQSTAEEWPLLPKSEVAARLCEAIQSLRGG